MNKKSIIIGSDHAGFNLKNKIIQYLKNSSYILEDIGCYDTNSTDYPVIAKKLANEVASGNYEKGILICGSGIGMSIAANRIKGVRAVVCTDTTSAKLSRLHNNSNVLCLGERIIGENVAKDICDIWLNTDFEAGRHLNRINLIDD